MEKTPIKSCCWFYSLDHPEYLSGLWFGFLFRISAMNHSFAQSWHRHGGINHLSRHYYQSIICLTRVWILIRRHMLTFNPLNSSSKEKKKRKTMGWMRQTNQHISRLHFTLRPTMLRSHCFYCVGNKLSGFSSSPVLTDNTGFSLGWRTLPHKCPHQLKI